MKINELQQQKAIEALDKQKKERRERGLAMIYHLEAYAKLHHEGVFLPYRVLYDLEKQAHEGTFKEVMPNPYYPALALSRALAYGRPTYRGDESKLPTATIEIDGNVLEFPDTMADPEFAQKTKEYGDKVQSEKMDNEKWGYYYARFLLSYDLSSFTDFDFWGKVPEDSEEKQAIDCLRAACLEVWRDCKAHPENYNFKPIPRLEEHKSLYDVDYGYI